MEVDGGEISLTFAGRTRDSGFGLISHNSDLVYRCNRPRSDSELHHMESGRGSPPKSESLSMMLRIGYITVKS